MSDDQPTGDTWKGLEDLFKSDQQREAVTQMARFIAHYYTELCEAGFQPGQALMLTVNFQQTVLLRSGK